MECEIRVRQRGPIKCHTAVPPEPCCIFISIYTCTIYQTIPLLLLLYYAVVYSINMSRDLIPPV